MSASFAQSQDYVQLSCLIIRQLPGQAARPKILGFSIRDFSSPWMPEHNKMPEVIAQQVLLCYLESREFFGNVEMWICYPVGKFLASGSDWQKKWDSESEFQAAGFVITDQVFFCGFDLSPDSRSKSPILLGNRIKLLQDFYESQVEIRYLPSESGTTTKI